jgi:hypothetical protein
MTIYDFVSSLEVGGKPVVWSNNPLTKGQIDASAGRPYIRVIELPESIYRHLHGHVDVIAVTYDVQIFQSPDSSSRVPNRTDAMDLFFALSDAPKEITEDAYGQPVIDCSRSVSRRPAFDRQTGGLFGFVRLRMLVPRA